MGVYDLELMYSWTPREFKNFITGAQLRKIDAYELSAASAIFNAKVKGKKRIKLKDVYDSEKARQEVYKGENSKKEPINLERYHKAKQAMKAYKPE